MKSTTAPAIGTASQSAGDHVEGLFKKKSKNTKPDTAKASGAATPAATGANAGQGDTRPIGENTTPEGKANNRRVKFIKM